MSASVCSIEKRGSQPVAARSFEASATSKGWSTGRTRAGSTKTSTGTVGLRAEELEGVGEPGAPAGAEVVDLAGDALQRQQAIAADDVADVGEVADDVEVADLDARLLARLDLGHLPGQSRPGRRSTTASARRG